MLGVVLLVLLGFCVTAGLGALGWRWPRLFGPGTIDGPRRVEIGTTRPATLTIQRGLLQDEWTVVVHDRSPGLERNAPSSLPAWIDPEALRDEAPRPRIAGSGRGFSSQMWTAAGWPMRSFTIPPQSWRYAWSTVEVPSVGVIWPGLLMNTLCFAGIIGVFWWAQGAVRRARRRRRGRCVRCGYDLRGGAGGAVCPECGGTR